MSTYDIEIPKLENLNKNIHIVIVSSTFNKTYTEKLLQNNLDFLKAQGFSHIEVIRVPGAFEIPATTKQVLQTKNADLILTLGVVVRGGTNHYDLITQECARAIMQLSLDFPTPIIFGILGCERFDQVEERSLPSASISGLNLLQMRSLL